MQNPDSQVENGASFTQQARLGYIRPVAWAGTSEMQVELLQQLLLARGNLVKGWVLVTYKGMKGQSISNGRIVDGTPGVRIRRPQCRQHPQQYGRGCMRGSRPPDQEFSDETHPIPRDCSPVASCLQFVTGLPIEWYWIVLEENFDNFL